MNYDPLVALVSMTPMKRLTEENAKKKSRWGSNIGDTDNIDKFHERSSKWGSEDYKPYLPLPFVDFPPGLTPSQLDQFLREQRFDELTKKLNKGELEYADPDIRPPSPSPIYDKNGSRINTREARIKNSMIEEHNRLVEYLLKHVEGFVAPPNYKPIKKIRKIEIPIDEYPEYNFMGLIIGPRGCNHKRLEAESGAQISIRGKGTLKEGKKTDHQTEIEANMPKHVHISADTEESIEKAVSLIIPLLDPKHPQHEEHKKKGLEQLAIVNGINISQLDTQRCSFCGSTTHISADCSENLNFQNFQKPEIKCNLCGDHGHITLDCKLAADKRNKPNGDEAVGDATEPNVQSFTSNSGSGNVRGDNNGNNNTDAVNNSGNKSTNNNASTHNNINHVHNPYILNGGTGPAFIPPPPSEDDFNKKKKKSPCKMENQQVDLEYQKMMRELTFSAPNQSTKKQEQYKKGGGGISQSSATMNKNVEGVSNQYNDSYGSSTTAGHVAKSGIDLGVAAPPPPPFFNNPVHYPPTLSQFMTDKNGELNANFIPLNHGGVNSSNTGRTAFDEISCRTGNGNSSDDVNKNINAGTPNNNNIHYSYRAGGNAPVRNSVATNKNYPPLMNMPNPNTFPLGSPPPLPIHLPPLIPPPFFNPPWNSNRNSANNASNTPAFPGPNTGPHPPMPLDLMYPHKYPNGWPAMPMNFAPDDPLMNAPPPDCNPPPLPSEDTKKELEQDI